MTDVSSGYAMWRMAFPGSGVYTGRDPAAVLKALSKRQWTEEDRVNIKAALAWRAYVTRDASLDPSLPDEDFLVALSSCGIIELSVYDERREEWLTF